MPFLVKVYSLVPTSAKSLFFFTAMSIEEYTKSELQRWHWTKKTGWLPPTVNWRDA